MKMSLFPVFKEADFLIENFNEKRPEWYVIVDCG